jgi:hypothetical protein
MSAAMKRGLGPLVLMALSGWACGETRLVESFAEGQTRIRLEPSEFVGSVTCRRGTPGALQEYMVRFQELDRTAPRDAGFSTAFTSGAAACDQAVMFTPLAGTFYGAEIFGFDRPINEADLRVPNLARWRATCGHGQPPVNAAGMVVIPDAGLDPLRPTLALRGFVVPMRGCTLFEGDTSGATELLVDQASALGSLSCGQGAGEVVGFEATLGGSRSAAACGQPLVFVVPATETYHTIELTGLTLAGDGGAAAPVADAQAPIPPAPIADASSDASVTDPLDAGAEAALDAAATDAAVVPPVAGVPRWRTQCVGRSLPGLRTSAVCDPLQPLP